MPTAKPTLAELVAQARWPRNRKTLQLEPHRKELLQLRRAGESVGAIRGGLKGLGIEISEEALRLWFKAQVRKPATIARQPSPLAAVALAMPVPPAEPSPTVAPPQPAEPPNAAGAVESITPPISLPALATETVLEKLARLRATLPPREPALVRSKGPTIARDDF